MDARHIRLGLVARSDYIPPFIFGSPAVQCAASISCEFVRTPFFREGDNRARFDSPEQTLASVDGGRDGLYHFLDSLDVLVFGGTGRNTHDKTEGFFDVGAYKGHLQDGLAGGGPSLTTGGQNWVVTQSEDPCFPRDYPQRFVPPRSYPQLAVAGPDLRSGIFVPFVFFTLRVSRFAQFLVDKATLAAGGSARGWSRSDVEGAESSVIQQEGGRQSNVDGFDGISADAFPAFLQPMDSMTYEAVDARETRLTALRAALAAGDPLDPSLYSILHSSRKNRTADNIVEDILSEAVSLPPPILYISAKYHAPARRDHWAKFLQQQSVLDARGECFNLNEHGEDSFFVVRKRLWSLVNHYMEPYRDPRFQKYSFYYSAHNLNARHYVDEKLLKAYFHGLVPIVTGPPRADLEKQYPPHSFIHTDDFDGREGELVDYIRFLVRNKTAYMEYHAWRRAFDVADLVVERTQGYLCGYCLAAAGERDRIYAAADAAFAKAMVASPADEEQMRLGKENFSCVLEKEREHRQREVGEATEGARTTTSVRRMHVSELADCYDSKKWTLRRRPLEPVTSLSEIKSAIDLDLEANAQVFIDPDWPETSWERVEAEREEATLAAGNGTLGWRERSGLEGGEGGDYRRVWTSMRNEDCHPADPDGWDVRKTWRSEEFIRLRQEYFAASASDLRTGAEVAASMLSARGGSR